MSAAARARADAPAAVVGAGPNGLAAAVTLARAGIPVTVFEAAETPGGGARTGETVLPGVRHDHCSAIHPLALASGFFRAFELERRVEFVVPEASYGHPLDAAPAAIAYRDLARTAHELGADGPGYARMFRPLLDRLDGVVDLAFGGSLLRIPSDLRAAATLGLRVLEQAGPLWRTRFGAEAAPALVTGAAAHAIAPLPGVAPSGVGLVLGALGHARGWAVPVGGSGAVTEALVTDLHAHGGRLETGHPISTLDELGAFGVVVFDTSAAGLARIAADALPAGYRRALERFRYGGGAAKVDMVLDGPIPWADPRLAATPTVHLGGSRAEIEAAERAVARGEHPEHPFVLLAQPDAFDRGRNPEGTVAIWSYTHVPSGSDVDVSSRVFAQIERFAPGFRDRIVAHRVVSAAELSRYNENYVGGDIAAGAVSMRQLIARPTLSRSPWRTPVPGIYLASSSTPPGPGVHGLSGWYAAIAALRHEYGMEPPALA